MPVDRAYYRNALRVPLETIFGPIAAQRLVARHSELSAQKKEREAAVAAELDLKLWRVLHGTRLEEAPEAKRARIESSPIARAFARVVKD